MVRIPHFFFNFHLQMCFAPQRRAVAGVVATVLYIVDLIAPCAFAGTMAVTMLIVYTYGFCARLGFGDENETPESKRSRRLCLRRVSSWAADVRKSTAADPQ